MTAFDVEPQGLLGSMGSAVLAGSLDAVVVMDSDGVVVEWNPAAEQMFGWARADAQGRLLADLIIPPEMREGHAAGLARHVKTGASTILGQRLEMEALRANGARFPVELTVTPVPTSAGPFSDGERRLFAGQVRDLSLQRQLSSALSASQQHLSAVVDTAPMALVSIDAGGFVRLARGRGVEHLGCRPSDVVGSHVARSWAVEPEVLDNVDRALRGETITRIERHGARLFETTYHPCSDGSGRVESVLAVAVDVTAREQDRSRLAYLVEHDALTGLANRAQFDGWAAEALAGAARNRTDVCLLLLDVDDFAALNAAHGTAVGDNALRAVAGAVAATLPPGSLLARLGGDDFAALIAPSPGRAAAGRIGHDVLKAIGEVAGDNAVTASIGLVLAPPGTTTDLALQRASAALAAARGAGGNTVRIHSPETSAPDSLRTARSEVQDLIDRPGAIRSVLQPLVGLATGAVVGYEALARFPGQESTTVHQWFLRAHGCGLGPALEAAAMRSAMARRPELDVGVYLSVNVSAAALTDPEVTESLSGDLTGIVVEITEHDQHLGPDALNAVDELRRHGARIAVDDAGAGYSGLTRLAQLRPDLVKLDRLLVSGIDAHPEQAALVSALVAYAGSTGATICAEGIETAEELLVLADLDVQVGQGWLLGRPDPVPLPPPPAAVAACLDSYRRQLAPRRSVPAGTPHGRRSLDGLAQVMSEIAGAQTLADLSKILPAIADLLHARLASLSRLDLGEGTIREVASTAAADHTAYHVADYPTTARVLADGSIAEVRLDDPGADRAECAAIEALGFGALLMLPLHRGDTAVGLLEIYAATPRPWSRGEIARARILGQSLADAVCRLAPVDGSAAVAGPSTQATADGDAAAEDLHLGVGADMFPGCAAGTTVRAACEGLTDDLREHGVQLPSVYLLVGGRLRCHAARGYFQVVDGFRPGTGVVGRTVTTGVTTVLPDVSADPAFVAARPDLSGEVCVPVVVDGSPVGAVNAESTMPLPEEWTPLLTKAAAALSDRLRVLGGLPADSLTQRLARAVAHLTSLSDAAAIEGYAVRAAADLAGMDSAGFVTSRRTAAQGDPPTDGDGAQVRGEPVYRLRSAVGPLSDAMHRFTPAQLEAMAAWVQAGTSSHFPGGSDTPPTHGFLADAGIRALCLNPLVASGEQLGMLVVADRGELPHDPAVVEVLELLAAQTATAWTTAMTITGLRRRAPDPLTELSNQGAFHRDLSNRLRTGRPGDRVCACLMVDVDEFKQVNDQRGHLAGDDLLRDLAQALRRALRDGDTLYRVGGDELAALVDVRDGEDALSVAHRLLTAARTTATTVSIGIALEDDDEPRTLVSRADRALYAAKRAGRDTARLAETGRC